MDLVTGNVVWRTLEVSIPGPAGMDIDVYRVRNEEVVQDLFPRWYIDFPWYTIYGERQTEYGVKLESGITVNIPGIGKLPFLLNSSGIYLKNATGPENMMWSTVAGWRAYFTGESTAGQTAYYSLKVLSPDGKEYYLKPGQVIVSDPLGNTITYSLGRKFYKYGTAQDDKIEQFSHVTQITASDGRKVVVNYEVSIGQRLKSLVVYDSATETRTWNYEANASSHWYTGYDYCNSLGLAQEQRNNCLSSAPVYIDDDLTKVTLPDGRTWHFAYLGETSLRRMHEVTYPTGMKVTYKDVGIDTGGYTRQLQRKILDENNGVYSDYATWNFRFNQVGNPKTTAQTLVSTPTGDVKYVYYSPYIGGETIPPENHYAVNLLKSIEYFDSDRTTLLRTEQFAYQGGRNWCSSGYENPTCRHFHLTKKTVDGQFVTSYKDFNANNWKPNDKTEWGGSNTRRTYYTYFDQEYNAASGARHFSGLQTSEKIAYNTGAPGDLFWTTSRDINALGQMTSETVEGITTSFTYHPSGDLATRTYQNHLGSVTDNFNSYYRGTPQEERLGRGARVITRKVNSSGTIQEETDGDRGVTTYTYDGLNRVLTSQQTGLPEVSYDYTDPRAVVVKKAGSGFKRNYRLDSLGQVIGIETEGSGLDTVYEKIGYDQLGRKTFGSYPYRAGEQAYGLMTEFDALSRPKRITNTADNSTITYCYGENCSYPSGHTGLEKYSVTDQRGFTKYFFKEGFADPAATWNTTIVSTISNTPGAEEYQPVSIERNKIGDVTSVSLGGLTRSYAYYDGTRRLRTITEPERGMVTLNYDAAGNLRTKLLAGANASPITYGYDSLNRLTSETYPDSTTGVAYTYDGANRLESTTSGLVSRGYQYEPWGALKTETVTIDDKSFELGYGYNGQGSLESITYPNNEVVSLNPDDWGRPTQVGNFASAISYYANDAAKSFTYGNGQVVSISQNNKQFVDGIASAMGAVVPMSQSYTFDEAGNITSIKESVNGDSTLPRMTYDGLNRLRDADGPWGTGRIDYDVKDNITKKRFGYYVLDYTYDATSNRLKSTRGIDYYPFDFTYDTQGNVTGNGRHQFNYDLAGRLISIDPSANQTVAGNPVSIDYLYDGHGFRALEVRDNRAFYQVHDKSGNLMYETNADDSEQSIYVRFNGQTIAKQDSCTNECTGADGAPVGDFGANADGQIVLEAEHFTSNAAVTNGHSWIEKSNSAYSGGVSMEAKPEDTIRYEEDKLALCPRMDYAIDFPSSGTYYVWVRGVGPNGSSDSLHIGLDGQTQAGSVKLSDYLPLGSLRWGHLMNGTTTPITVNVSSAGLHTLNVWMRESGMIADKIVLTQDANFVPAGSGPDETTHELLPNNAPVVTSTGIVEAQVGVVYAYDLVATDADNDGLNYRLTTAPTGMTITKYSGQIRWTPVQGQEGNQSVIVEVIDGRNPVTQAFTVAVKAKDPVFQADESGMVVIEAEHYLTQRASFDSYPWQKMTNAAVSNGEHILINDAATVEFPNGYEGFVTDAAAATYKVNFPAAGTWYVWVRGNGPDGTSDSLHVGIDGTPDMAMSALTGFYPREAWAWGNKENATKVAVYVTVPTAGEHVFNIWMRESGLGVDKFILTQNSAYKPGASTLGPVESRQE